MDERSGERRRTANELGATTPYLAVGAHVA